MIAYGSIADVTITAARSEGAGGIGFGRACGRGTAPNEARSAARAGTG